MKKILALALVVIVAASACAVDFDFTDELEGSGQRVTERFEVGDFDEVEIGNDFAGQIVVVEDANPTVDVTLDDNLFRRLKVENKDGVLKVEIEHGYSFDTNERALVSVVLPHLDTVDVSGAAEVGVNANDSFVSKIDASGASQVNVGGVDGGELVIDTSGVAEVKVSGTVNDLKLDASGASTQHLGEVVAELAQLDVSGSAAINLGPVDHVKGDASGASQVTVTSTELVEIDTSGVAQISRVPK